MTTTFPTNQCAPAAEAPAVTGLVAHCSGCGTQWQVKSQDRTDATSCGFCGATGSAITLENEDPASGHNVVVYD